MKEIILKYNPKNAIAKKTIEYILSLGVFHAVNKTAIEKSLEEVKKGHINKYNNTNELFGKILK